MKNNLKICLIQIFLLLFSSTLTLAADVKITFSLGQVDYKQSGQDDWKAASKGFVLTDKDFIRTGNSSTAMIEIENSLKMKISANTTLKLETLFPKAELSFSGGKVWVQLNKLSQNQTFNIRTPTSLIGVRGTEFIYEHGSIEDRVYVLDGIVLFGKDFETSKEITKGKIAVLKGKNVLIRDITPNEDLKFRNGFPIIITKDRLNNLMIKKERAIFKSEIRKELNALNITRQTAKLKAKEDLTTGRTLTDKNGDLVRIQQLLRKSGPNQIQLINITKKTNFINVLEYKGTYKDHIPNTIKELINIGDTQNQEIKKELYIIQRDGSIYDKLLLVKDNAGTFTIATAQGFNGTLTPANVGDFDRLKQRGTNPYLNATYYDGTGSPILSISIFILDKDGNVISADPNSGGIPMDLDSLASMSFQIAISGGNLNAAGLQSNVLTNIGFVIIANF